MHLITGPHIQVSQNRIPCTSSRFRSTHHYQTNYNLHASVPVPVDRSFGKRRYLLSSSKAPSRGGDKRSSTHASNNSNNNNLNPIQQFFAILYEARVKLFASAVARATAIFTTFPIDTIKTRLQSSPASSSASSVILSASNQNNGLFQKIASYYPGLFSAMVGQIPYGMLTFGTYDMYKSALSHWFPALSKGWTTVLAAASCDLTGSIWVVPSEVVKQKLQSGALHMNSTAEAVRQVYRQSGVMGFYQGYSAQIARDLPFRVIQILSFEQLRAVYVSKYKKKSEENSKPKKKGTATTKPNTSVVTNPIEDLLIGAISGSFTAAVTCPFDVVKTSMMTQGPGSTRLYNSVWDCFAKIIQGKGVQGLFQGVIPRVVNIGPSTAIFFLVFESMKKRLETSESKSC